MGGRFAKNLSGRSELASWCGGSAQNSCSPRFLNWPAPRGTRRRKRLAFLGRRRIGIARHCSGGPPPSSRRVRLQKIERSSVCGAAGFHSNQIERLKQ